MEYLNSFFRIQLTKASEDLALLSGIETQPLATYFGVILLIEILC
jgi:hypothetical protein